MSSKNVSATLILGGHSNQIGNNSGVSACSSWVLPSSPIWIATVSSSPRTMTVGLCSPSLSVTAFAVCTICSNASMGFSFAIAFTLLHVVDGAWLVIYVRFWVHNIGHAQSELCAHYAQLLLVLPARRSLIPLHILLPSQKQFTFRVVFTGIPLFSRCRLDKPKNNYALRVSICKKKRNMINRLKNRQNIWHPQSHSLMWVLQYPPPENLELHCVKSSWILLLLFMIHRNQFGSFTLKLTSQIMSVLEPSCQ